MNAIRPIATLLATAALATLPLAANAHKDNAKHDHGTNAHAQEPQGVDKVLTPEQIDLSSGKAELQPHGPKEGYFFVNVISGTLQLGFGDTYDASKLQTLPPGSIFTHPAGQQHFAKTGNEPVVLQITAINPHGGKKHDHHHHSKKHDHAKGHQHGKSGE